MQFTYLGLKAKLERHTVTEGEVNHQLERLRQLVENGEEILKEEM